ncbi:DUF6993 domain-containing protein [Microbacterium karelineae]|uniref:DUF6993 domain-containing protein n=1 Tax=Microbacterium karelineae TaxID=2654283 RepID=UPI0012EA7C55|nr:hypothetical protein [Microbacterium karelineae]
MSFRPSRLIVVPALLAVASLVACAPETGEAEPTPDAAPTATPTPSETPAPEPVKFSPDGSAEDNLPVFQQAIERAWASDGRAQGRTYVDMLAEVGFDISEMQVSKDLSTVGNAAETMMVSVRWSDSACLVGQFGPDTPEPVATVLEPVDGVCLPGETAAIE